MGARLSEVQTQARKLGWRSCASPALRTTGGGLSGGAAIFARKGIGLTDVKVPPGIRMPAAHRVSLTFANIMGGVVLASVYLTTGIGMAGDNTDFLDQLGELLTALHRPFVLGGDFNMHRDVLDQSGWLRAVRAKVVGPPAEQATCLTATSSSAIDYFVVSEVLLAQVRWSAIDQGPTVVKTHRPVQMQMIAPDFGRMIRVARRPVNLPVLPMIGPCPKPPSYESAAAAVDALLAAPAQISLDQALAAWAQTAEVEVLSCYDLQDSVQHQNRIREPRFVWVPAVSRQRGSAHGGCSAATWHLVADRLRELWFLHKAGKEWSRHAAGLRSRLCKVRWPANQIQPGSWHDWTYWRASLGEASQFTVQFLQQFAAQEAEKAENSAALERARGWRVWARETAMADGARLAHRWCKPAPAWTAMPSDDEGFALPPQAAAESIAGVWHSLWEVDSPDADLEVRTWKYLCEQASEQEPLVPPTVNEVRMTAATFSRFTATGCDHLHPKHIGRLSVMAVQLLIDLFFAGFNLGMVPTVLHYVYIVLLPKETGGTRPIGIFSSVVRLFMRWLRRQVTDRWEASVPRPYWFGCRGASVQHAVWRASLAGEFARATRKSAASALIDLEKAFERIFFSWLCQAAVKYKFPLRLLRGLLSLYAGPRCVIVDGVATSVVRAVMHGVIAGCAHATALMRLALLESLDTTQKEWPLVQLTVVVDDTQVQAVGPERLVEQVVQGAARTFCDHARSCARLVVHPGKLNVVASATPLQQAIQRAVGAKASKAVSVRNLGVDFSGGRQCTRKQVQERRMQKAKKKLPFLKRLRQAGARVDRLVRTGLIPAMVWGCEVNGLSARCLLKARRMARAAARSATRGRSLDLSLALLPKGTDPADRGMTASILTWKAALLDSWAPQLWMHVAMQKAIKDVDHPDEDKDWEAVAGPAGAVVASGRRLGWTFVSASEFASHMGPTLVV